MSKSKKNVASTIAECVYCGLNGPITDDHVPPKNLFPYPRPSNLITVPACNDCNKSFSKDDEWLRLTLSIREISKTHPDRNAALPIVKRSLERPSARGFSRDFQNNVHKVPRFSS